MTGRTRYATEASSWALDTRRREARSERIAWTAATVAAGVAALQTVALVLLIPLKTIQPIALLVDRQTGFVQALDPQTPHRIKADTALTESLLAQYVAAREAFDRATIASEYRRVVLWSAGRARASYVASMPASNPESPLQRYAAGTVVETHVKSVSPLGAGTALVRFDTRHEDGTGREGPDRPWIAIIRYRYSDAEMSFESRLANPLGFQVVSYRRDAEAPATIATEQPEHIGGPVSRPADAPRAVPYQAQPPRSQPRSIASTDLGPAARGLAPDHIPHGSPLDPSGAAGPPTALIAR